MAHRVLSIFGVVPQRIGGVETFARELSEQLSGAGWESVVCFLDKPSGAVRRFVELPGVRIEAAPACASIGWAGIRQVDELLCRYHPEIVHLHFVDMAGPHLWLARLRSVSRIYLTDQTSRPEGYIPTRSSLWKRAIRRAVYWPVSGLVPVSDYVARVDEALGSVPRGRVSRIYNAVDLTRPPGDPSGIRKKYRIPENRRIVLQVSWIIPEKGIPDLLDAARLVIASDPGVQFVIAGEGAWRKAYSEYAADAGIGDHVTWTGLVEDPIREGLYDAAEVVCQLSRWQEAFGWTNAEAMACRKPVIATDVGGQPEIICDGVTGFIVPRRQPAAAAQRILQLLGDAALRQRMGDAGRARVEQLFDLRQNVSALLDAYRIPRPTARACGAGGNA